MTLIAQITDPHLRDDGADPFHDPAQAMRQAFAQITAMDRRPDAIVLTGDIIDRSASGYAHVLPLLREAPVELLPMPGNHDRSLDFRSAFSGWAEFHPDHLSFTRQIGETILVALDSNLPDGKAGVDAVRLDWLSGELNKAQRPVILAMHHPPFPTGAPHLDRVGFAGAKALSALVEGSAVCRVVSGHSHRAIQSLWAGCIASTAPAIGYGLSLSLNGDHPHSPIQATPGFELHALCEGGNTSHLVLMAEWPQR